MITLAEFKRLNLKITWKLINIGFKNNKYFGNMLSAEEVIGYAIEQLLNCDNDIIIQLAGESVDNTTEIMTDVHILAEHEDTEYSKEFRKWRVMYVIKSLPNIKTEFITGLVELGDIWAYLDFPNDSPHLFQGKGNSLEPKQYYTQNNYNELLNKHRIWIEDELKELNDTDKLSL